jgi:hypothetical protein
MLALQTSFTAPSATAVAKVARGGRCSGAAYPASSLRSRGATSSSRRLHLVARAGDDSVIETGDAPGEGKRMRPGAVDDREDPCEEGECLEPWKGESRDVMCAIIPLPPRVAASRRMNTPARARSHRTVAG